MDSQHLTLYRCYFPHGTFGELKDAGGNTIAVTVECPWLNNQKGKSCIPEGTYQIRRHQSPSKGICLAIEAPTLGVTLYGPSQRTHCLIHVANCASELQGCIASGESFGVVGKEWGVLQSRDSLEKLLALVGEQTYTLVVRGQ
ncbi:DUF5675 family protein [Shewanella psychrotolerans]|uniref:DUF5675 family protein n=1 Tax=Shewanella psychrotolerans TaxID=2864206 RepID=UPI001C6585C1|nr:DUF5675 family protein [Shewanella psychrotolerans]QYK02781.1 hypothetical protein K0I62_07530 [Shewanella psychrotolerans]